MLEAAPPTQSMEPRRRVTYESERAGGGVVVAQSVCVDAVGVCMYGERERVCVFAKREREIVREFVCVGV